MHATKKIAMLMKDVWRLISIKRIADPSAMLCLRPN
jgi:hypothetical protein